MKPLLHILFLLSFCPIILAQEERQQDSNWQQDGPLTPNFNGQTFRGWVDAICVNAKNPLEMLIATRTSGIFRTENGGQHWYCVTDSLPQPMIGCRTMISLPTEPNRVIAISGYEAIEGGVVVSDDFGRTWRNIQQDLPTFRWIDFHPSNPNILFACSNKTLYYSPDKGEEWKVIGAPDDINLDFNEMFKVFVKENSVCVISKARWAAEAFMHECSFRINDKNKIRSVNWTTDLAVDYQLSSDDKVFFIDFSNRVGNVHCLQLESKKGKQTFRTIDGGISYAPISIPRFPVGHWWKNELIVSPTDTSILYWGQVGFAQKFNLKTGKSVFIQNDSVHPGHHDDYRSSHVIVWKGKDYLALGHDGGVGLVSNGLDELPTIRNANGDLSINLIHSFDVHEKTKRIVFAYQDGPMFYRDKDGTFSEHFLWEGSAAMIQQQYPDEMVGENAYIGIMDKSEIFHPIVNGTLGQGGCYLGGYFVTYRHYPNRFARGLRGGKITMNRDANVSDVVSIPNTNSDVGAVAFCARNPNYVYAATTSPDQSVYKLHASTDDGKTWRNLTTSTVKIEGETRDLNTYLHWNFIKSIAVDPDSGNVVFCGIAGTYQPNGRAVGGIYRVIKSTDGGKKFMDYSTGLPAVPVDEILAIESDNGLLFCATVYGVFYRTREMGSWLPFSNQLPKVEITGLKYDYCNDILYASTYGRGLWKTKVGFEVPNRYTEVITQDETWSENKIIYDNIRVASGATLTIKARIEMYRGKEITVDHGGKLTLEGGSISEFCRCE